jgi:protein SCO1/2
MQSVVAAPKHARVAALVAMAIVPVRASAQINTLPPELHEVGVDEHLDRQIPMDGAFRDHEGHAVRLSQYFDGRRPVVLDLAYYRCPMLCNMVLNALVNGLRQTGWTVGREFDVVTVSIDPREVPHDAAEKREHILDQYGRGDASHGWHFLTGDEIEIRRLADAVGFRYRYDARQQQYAHPAVVFLLTPGGHIARYLYGIEYNPNDLRVGLLEASRGHSITTVERILLFCYHYDPQGRRYVLVATRIMQLGGVATIVLLGGFLGVLWGRERFRRTSAQPPSSSAHAGDPPSRPSDVRS